MDEFSTICFLGHSKRFKRYLITSSSMILREGFILNPTIKCEMPGRKNSRSFMCSRTLEGLFSSQGPEVLHFVNLASDGHLNEILLNQLVITVKIAEIGEVRSLYPEYEKFQNEFCHIPSLPEGIPKKNCEFRSV